MARVPRKDTKPERIVRSMLHRTGYRFRLHRRDLPGSPDIVLPSYKIAIFVHGCFWHQHPRCRRAKRPTSNIEYWERKLDDNVKRDKKNVADLKRLGWEVAILWQCETEDVDMLKKRLKYFIPKKRRKRRK